MLLSPPSTGSVTATGNSYSYAGGVVGQNNHLANLTACYATSNVNGDGEYVGGVVGYNAQGIVSACYWNSKVTNDTGIGSDMSNIGEATKVDGDWTEAMNAMNKALSSTGWQYVTSSGDAPLTLQRQN